MHYHMGHDYVSIMYEGYKPNETFVLSSNTERTISSAKSQLDGLFGNKFTWPNKNASLDVNVIPDKEDFLIHSNHDCKRFTYIKDKINRDPNTKKMFADLINEYETSGFFPKIRKITNQLDASSKQTLLICNYL